MTFKIKTLKGHFYWSNTPRYFKYNSLILFARTVIDNTRQRSHTLSIDNVAAI